MSELPFQYVAGDPSLDFVNTVDWTSDGLVDERLTSYERVTRWAEGAGVLPRVLAASLRDRALRQPRRAQQALSDVRRVRALLQRVLAGIAGGKIDGKDLHAFNQLLNDALAHRLLNIAANRAQWMWRDREESLTSFLWPVVLSAADLLASEEAPAIRVCGGPACGWIFVDRSRNGLRRWCEMQSCGTREKSRRRAART